MAILQAWTSFEIGTTENKFLPTGDCWVCRSLYCDLTLATPLNIIFFPIPPRAPSRRHSKPLMFQKEVDIKSVSLLIYLTV